MSTTRSSFSYRISGRHGSSDGTKKRRKKEREKRRILLRGIKRFAMSEMRKVLSIRCCCKIVAEHSNQARSLYARNIRADGNKSSGKQSEILIANFSPSLSSFCTTLLRAH